MASIEADFNDEPYLVLKAGGDMDMFNQPQARLAKGEIDKAANLKKGQKINLVCVGNSEIAGTPMLKDCFSKKPSGALTQIFAYGQLILFSI